MATVTTVTYAAPAAITIGLATTPLASSTTTGVRESNEIDNTTNKYVDCIVQGKVTVGTTPTTAKSIKIYVWGADTSLATLTYDQSNAAGLDTLTGADGDRTLTNTETLQSMLRLGAVISVIATTSNVTYPFAPFTVAPLFGGQMPKYWGIVVQHDTGAALNGTANNHAFAYTGITYTST